MLLNFFIDPEAIDDNINRSHINALRNKWQQFGVLAHPSHNDGAFRDLRRKFPHLTQENRRLWNASWQEIENDPVRFLRCRDLFQVALISEQLAVNEQILDGDSKYVRGVEAIRFTQVNDSKEFRRAEDLSRKRIEIDELITDIWQERFQQLAGYAHKVVIVDEWAVREDNIEGLVRFLNLLDENSSGCAVTVYSSPETEHQEEVKTISDRLSNRTSLFSTYGISSVEIRLRPEDDFRLYAHERHVRFDNRVFNIGRGLRTFQYETVREATDTSFILLPPNTLEGKENDLDEKAYRLSDFCLPIGAPNSP